VNVSRATFFKVIGLALLGARVDARTLLPAVAAPPSRPDANRSGGRFLVQDATAAAFRPHVNTSFAVRSADGTDARLVLVKVVERPVTRQVEQFSLVFHAHGGGTLADGIHAVRHPALGAFDLFIAPIGGSKRPRPTFEACFGRRVDRSAGRV